jgi:hypothetical protein
MTNAYVNISASGILHFHGPCTTCEVLRQEEIARGKAGKAGDPSGSARMRQGEPPPVPLALRLVCEQCGTLHIDEGEFATRPHKTHTCQHCGAQWQPALVPTVGVRFLPGCQKAPGGQSGTTPVAAAESAGLGVSEEVWTLEANPGGFPMERSSLTGKVRPPTAASAGCRVDAEPEACWGCHRLRSEHKESGGVIRCPDGSGIYCTKHAEPPARR